MSAEAPALARSWRVGRYRCTLTAQKPTPGTALCVSIEWEPDVPGRLSRKDEQAYVEGRDRALAELMSMIDQ
jgi:hypothetical protein